MRFIATTSDKVNDIAISSGQLIFSRNDRVIYLDTDVRTSFQQIITVVNEETRQNMPYPVTGFYFIKDTKALWSYDGEWDQISGGAPKECLIFADYANFPVPGEPGILYIDKNKMYQWEATSNAYLEIGSSTIKWETI